MTINCVTEKKKVVDANMHLTKKIGSIYAIASALVLSNFPWEYSLIAGILLDFDKLILAVTG